MNFAEATKQKMSLLRTGIGLLILVIAAITWAGYRMLDDFRASGQSLLEAYELREKLENTLAHVREVETAARDFLLSREAEQVERFDQSSALLVEQLFQLRVMTRLDPEQLANVARLEELSQGLIVAGKKSIDQRNRSLTAALRVFRGENTRCLGEDIRTLMDEMRAHEKTLLTRGQQAALLRVRINAASCGLVLAADLAVLVWIGVLSFRLNRLHRVIRVCAWTKQVEHEGKWITLEEYLQATLDAPVTHGICAEAAADIVAASEKDQEETRLSALAERR